jgi:hypothetical protein
MPYWGARVLSPLRIRSPHINLSWKILPPWEGGYQLILFGGKNMKRGQEKGEKTRQKGLRGKKKKKGVRKREIIS